jgi:bifunctional non-homologous end joining protein LigD
LVDRPPAGPEWLHEVKHDGCRVLALKRNGRVRLWSRRATGLTDKLARIAATVRDLPADEALIDGEAVVLRADGRSDFEALLTKRGGEAAAYVAFDLLGLDRQDMRPQRLEDRRTALKRLMDGAMASCSATRSRPRARSSSGRPASSASSSGKPASSASSSG